MGSYFALIIKKYDLISGKSYLDPSIGILFIEDEKEIFTDCDGYEKYIYRSTASRILQRLSIWGFTPKRARKEFEVYRIKTIKSQTDDGRFWGNDILHKLTIDKWSEYIIRIITDKNFYCRWNARESNDEMYQYILENDDFYFGFPANDLRYMLAIVLTLFSVNEEIILDYSELVHGGYYEKNINMVSLSRDILRKEKLTNEHIIILTEGKFDTFVLKETLALFYQDVTDSFSFLDFDISKTPGGAGQLVNYIKALSGAQITDRILAIFDNDSAAYDAMKQIDIHHLDIPNINYFHYPDYELLNNYPTIGPSGIVLMNVNNLAGSIELYLGTDVLLENGNLLPVQWTGYIKGIKKYQGEIINKKAVQERFNNKIETCKSDKLKMSDFDWNGIKLIWETIFDVCSKNAV